MIAAQRRPAVGFDGLAPGAGSSPWLSPSTDEIGGSNDATRSVDTGTFAAALRWASRQHVGVLAVPAVTYTDDPRLRAAIQDALAANIVVIASVGDAGSGDQADAVPYPAAYDGVVGRRRDRAGRLVVARDRRPAISSTWSLQAPTDLDPARWRAGGGQRAPVWQPASSRLPRRWYGPAFRTLTVAAGRAATRGRRRRPRQADRDSREYGQGVPDPYQAVTDRIVAAPAEPVAVLPSGHARLRAAGRTTAWTSSRSIAVALTVIGMLVLLGIVLAAVAIPRGRRRRWRPTVATPPTERPEADLPAPPVQLFDDAQ